MIVVWCLKIYFRVKQRAIDLDSPLHVRLQSWFLSFSLWAFRFQNAFSLSPSKYHKFASPDPFVRAVELVTLYQPGHLCCVLNSPKPLVLAKLRSIFHLLAPVMCSCFTGQQSTSRYCSADTQLLVWCPVVRSLIFPSQKQRFLF